MKLTSVTAAALFTISCGAAVQGPPEVVLDRTACSHCGMLISDLTYAAGYQADGAESRAFDDIGCLIAAARKEGSTPRRFWFHDATGRGWIEGDAATFVASSEIRSPMGGGILAYGSASAAAEAAVRYHGKVVRSVHDLMNREGAGQ